MCVHAHVVCASVCVCERELLRPERLFCFIECGVDDIPANMNDSDVEPLMLDTINTFTFG